MSRLNERYSISRAAYNTITKGTVSGLEAEWSATLQRSISDKFSERVGGLNNLAPASAFHSPATRAVDITSGKAFIGTRPIQLSGPLAWSAVLKSGATLLGPLKDNITLFFDSALPVPTWQAEGAAVIPADINFSSAPLTPHRITAQIITSKQLILQFAGSSSLDEFLTARLKAAFASQVDKSCLYGSGPPQPSGIVTVSGCQSITTAVPPIWSDLTNMRYLSTNHDTDLSSFGWITSQQGRKYLESTPRFTNAAGSMWDFMAKEAEVSLEVTNQLFAGVWGYQVIGYWLGDSEGGVAADMVYDPWSRAERGELVLTGSVWVDVSPRWPQLFAYSQPNIFP